MTNKQTILVWIAAALLCFGTVLCKKAFAQRAGSVVDELPLSLDLTQMDTADFAGTEFYQLKRGHLVLVVSTDPHNPAAEWLRKHLGKKVVIVFSGE